MEEASPPPPHSFFPPEQYALLDAAIGEEQTITGIKREGEGERASELIRKSSFIWVVKRGGKIDAEYDTVVKKRPRARASSLRWERRCRPTPEIPLPPLAAATKSCNESDASRILISFPLVVPW